MQSSIKCNGDNFTHQIFSETVTAPSITDYHKIIITETVGSTDVVTHCDVIAALSDQFPIKVSLERRFIRFIKKCLSSSNSIVNVISQIAICNPMSTAG